ncbi:cytochrome d ubiquinol oxidase subunit II [Algoriphagus formosus]|uniref:cytochrome d ubiquinol oxidase subunit II n=1 Tax=Algoriphagus formosus TaxID=2007308 RepID=UPI000C285543|nr:cytochrome d ubiquinol oxidase subunit II [Algoriphagus formosus]
MDYNIVWYILVGVLLIGYAILDGFDLGVGILHLRSKGDYNRRIMMNAIGPVWDGNEVWLITAGGALFAAFPNVYATAFSGFYLPFMLLLIALIFRAVSIEFRSKEENPRWRNFWDWGFSLGSIVAALLFGIAIGNVVIGFPIGSDMEYQGNFFDLLNPYSLMAGFFSLSMFALHGGIYLNMKTEGDLQKQIQGWIKVNYWIFVLFYLVFSGFTLYLKPEMIANFSFGQIELPGNKHELVENHQILISVFAWTIVLLNILAIMNIPRMMAKGREGWAFISSGSMIAAIVMLFALGIFPNLMVSNLDPAFNLDIYNAASSGYTLKTMAILAAFGLPFVASYTIIIYWTYRGKVRLDESSY